MTLASRLRKSLLISTVGIGALYVTTWRAEAAAFVQTNLVSDIAGLAAITDLNLKNPWGISHGPTTPFWISNQGTNQTTLYNVTSSGVSQGATFTIPTTASGPQGPTGQVSNLIPPGNTPAPAFLVNGIASRFIFANLNGTISAWNGQGTAAIIQATTPGAVYTGLAVNDGHTLLYAANDAGAGGINVFDSTFQDVTSTSFAGKFVDPNIPAGFVPFNVQDLGGKVYVTYAPLGRPNQIAATEGMGFVDVFDENGNFLQRVISQSKLAAPWGITLAPVGFGDFGGDLLVGNFSFAASEINAFDPMTGAFEGTIPVDVGAGNTPGGLWALAFGNAPNNGTPNTLFFNDGINGERDGLFASIAFVPEPSSLALLAAAIGFLGFRRARSGR